MAASLSTAERRILEAAEEAESEGVANERLTDVVRRRTLAEVTGAEFRQGVAELHDRGLLRAEVALKPGGVVGRVVIERVTPLGRGAIGRGSVARWEPSSPRPA